MTNIMTQIVSTVILVFLLSSGLLTSIPNALFFYHWRFKMTALEKGMNMASILFGVISLVLLYTLFKSGSSMELGALALLFYLFILGVGNCLILLVNFTYIKNRNL